MTASPIARPCSPAPPRCSLALATGPAARGQGRRRGRGGARGRGADERPQFVYTDEKFDQWVFGDGKRRRGRRDRARLAPGHADRGVDRTCGLTDAQKKKLRSPAGATQAVLRPRRREEAEVPAVKNDQNKIGEIFQEIQPLQTSLDAGPVRRGVDLRQDDQARRSTPAQAAQFEKIAAREAAASATGPGSTWRSPSSTTTVGLQAPTSGKQARRRCSWRRPGRPGSSASYDYQVVVLPGVAAPRGQAQADLRRRPVAKSTASSTRSRAWSRSSSSNGFLAEDAAGPEPAGRRNEPDASRLAGPRSETCRTMIEAESRCQDLRSARPSASRCSPSLGLGRQRPGPRRAGRARSSRATSARCTTAACSTSPRPQTEQRRLAGGGEPGAGHHRHGPDGLPRLGRRPQLRPLQQPRPQGACGTSSRRRTPSTGIIGNSMYHHGFAMLGLAEAYGAVDERNLWPDGEGAAIDRPGARAGRPRGDHLAEEEPARRLALLARRDRRRHLGQRRGARRPARGPERRDRGPRRVDRQGDRLLQVDDLAAPARSATPAAWAGSATRMARISIATLVYAVARRKDLPAVQGDARLPQAAARAAAAMATPNTPATTRPRRSSRGTSRPGRSGTSCWSAS